MLIFQERSSGKGIRIWAPEVGDPCPAGFMTAVVPPDPCGALGGLAGTIYAPHVKPNPSTGDGDVGISIKLSGVANLQIITAQLTLEKNSDARLTYKPEEFADGLIHLVE